MKTRAAMIGLAVIALFTAGAEPASPLKPFTSAQGNFTVLLPGIPTEEKVPIADPKGEPAEQVQFALDRGNGAYVVSYQDNPRLAAATMDEANHALASARDTVQEGFKGKLLNERKIKLQDTYPGLAFELEVPAGPGIFRARMYLVKGRLHQVIAVGTPEFAKAAEAQRVLDSFKLVKP